MLRMNCSEDVTGPIGSVLVRFFSLLNLHKRPHLDLVLQHDIRDIGTRWHQSASFLRGRKKLIAYWVLPALSVIRTSLRRNG